MASPETDESFPELSPSQWSRLIAYGTGEDTSAGAFLFCAGDPAADMIVIESGRLDIVRVATGDAAEAIVASHGPGRFSGELNLLTGQGAWLSGRVGEAGRVYRLSADAFRKLMDQDPELSDIVLRALLARRRNLRGSEANRSLQIIGSNISAAALALRTYVARQELPHRWIEVDSPAGAALIRAAGAGLADLPVVITPTAVLRCATPGKLAGQLGLAYRPTTNQIWDVVVVGAGPAGLAATVYGASEGLSTLLLDAVATGGQAASSSRIENYLGFTSGISGAELTSRAGIQAQKFGADIATPCSVRALTASGDHWDVDLDDGRTIAARAVVVATGARYRSLPLQRWADFEGAGIYYAATDLEARACDAQPVAVIGGANSAGQAALYLAGRGSAVTLVVRGADLTAGMSAYLADRIVSHPQIAVRTGASVTQLRGTDHLEEITITAGDGATSDQPCGGLFCFIGAVPATDWLDGVILDDHGFVLTDYQLDTVRLPVTWSQLNRRPLAFETSQPGIFAIGDVRSGSMKRVAAAVGEGSSAIRSVHSVLGSLSV